MKGKFRILGRIGLGVFMVCALMLAFMPVAPVSADVTEVTDVWIEFPMSDTPNIADSTANIYIVHFKPTTALLRGTDYVTVTFPDGSEAMGGDGTTDYAFTITDANIDADEVEFSTDYGTAIDTADLDSDGPTWNRTTSVTGGGYRVKSRVPVDIAAEQDVWLKFDTTDGIDAAATQASTYRVYVSTTKDTTPVLSNKFAIGTSVCQAGTSIVDSYPLPATAGATATYVVKFVPENNLTQSSGKVTVKFPIGTTLPSSLEITDVGFGTASTSFTSTPEAPVVNANTREVTAVTPFDITQTDTDDWFIQIKGIENPTTAAGTGTYKVMVRTSADGQYDIEGTGYAITPGSPSQILVANGEIGTPTSIWSDDATMVDMYSSQIYLGVADQYGNAKDPESDVTVNLSSSSGTGAFYWIDGQTDMTHDTAAATSCTTVTVNEQDPNHSDGDQIVYYKDGTAGTHTLTFSATDYPDVEWTFSVVPGVSVYDSSDTLVKTYAPLASAPPAETGDGTLYVQKYSYDYINDAIDGAMAGDTVKLGDGIYEIDTSIDLDKKITLTSVNGASSTTIRPTTDILHAIWVKTDGTSSDPIIIDGFTIQRLRNNTGEIQVGVRNDGYDYATVRNCTFKNIYPTRQIDNNDYGSVIVYLVVAGVTGADSITSATISNNTFIDCGSETWPENSGAGGKAGIINFEIDGAGQYTMTGVTISGNTLTNCNGYGIRISGSTHSASDVEAYYITASIKDNIITNGYSCINISWATRDVSITGNTITDPYSYGIKNENALTSSLTIKNNTITGTRSKSTHGTVRIEYEPNDPRDSSSITDDPSSYPCNIQYNDIYDNNCPAIEVDSRSGETITVSEINCRYNYYGDASGPAYTAATGATVLKSNPNGTGDAVTDRVFYYPWLHKPLADVVADNVSWQTSIMKLVLGGWNTLSTPVQLIESADTIDELISEDDMEIGYYYDGGWTQITTGYVLSPCDAVYVKMKSTASTAYVQLKFECETFSTPSKDLAVGWNLISLAYLNSAGLAADEAVASVALDSAGLPGYSQVISPSLNATRYDLYYNTDTAGWSHSSGQTVEGGTMYAGMGYWIYMQNTATLAGFEITPIAPDLD